MIASETNLFAEISVSGLHYFFQQEKNKTVTGLSVLNFNSDEKTTAASILGVVLDNEQILKEKFNKIFISYAFDESILTPGLYYNVEQNVENLNLIFGDLNQGVVLTDHVAEKNIYNIYRVPDDVHHEVTTRFPEATFTHQYSLLIKQLPHFRDLLQVLFYPNKIVITLQKEDRLQIIQAYNYITPQDVLFHMLNVCNLFGATNVPVQLGGMIKKDSALHKEIQKYFLNIIFPDLPRELSYADKIKELPAHFFNHLFAFSVCV